MTSLFKDILMENESIIKNESVLDFEFLPDQFSYREPEKKEIAFSIKPLLEGRKPFNLFVYGEAGIGKTSCVKYVYRDLSKNVSSITPVYVNCWESSSSYNILCEIARQLGLVFVDGKSSKQIFDMIVDKVRKTKGVTLCLDEIDKLCEFSFLYSLSNHSDKISTIMVTNNKKFLMHLDSRIVSRLSPSSLEFKNYTHKELYDILAERVKLGFVKGSFDESIIELVVEETIKQNSDVRKGIFLLRESGLNAEKASRKKVTREDFEKAKKALADFSVKPLTNLRDDEALIIELVKKNEGVNTGKLYNLYRANGGALAERSFRRYLKKLASQSVLELKKTTNGFRGKSSLIFLKG